MPPRKRARNDASSSSSSAAVPTNAIILTGGYAQPPRTIDKFRSGALCDVEVRSADGTPFRAHAVCFTAASGYMESLYSGADWADAEGPLTLAEVPTDALRACIEFIYCGEAKVDNDASLRAVLEAAAYLQIEALATAAAEAMITRLGPETAFASWGVAERHGLQALAEKAKEASARHFGDIVLTDVWLSAPTSVVRVLLACDRLAARDEADVYKAAVAWLRAQTPPLSDEEAAALLSHVRFPLLSRNFVRETVKKEPIMETVAGLRVLNSAFEAATYGDADAACTRRRIGFEKWLYAVGGRALRQGSYGNPTSIVERYDPATNSWEAVASMSTVRWRHSAAVLDGKLYVAGGYDGNDLSSVERYDPATNTWEAVASMSTVRSCHSAAVLDGKLYVAGGCDSDGLSLVERYDPATNTWEAVASMSTVRSCHSAAVLDGKLYVAGGFDRDAHGLSSVERYDPATNTWEAVASMCTVRWRHSAAVLDGKLYVAGGCDRDTHGLSSVERYDPATNTWEAVVSMSTVRYCHSAAVLDGKLYVTGGYDGNSRLDSMERYDPATNAWEAVASMSTGRSVLVCCAL